LAEKKEFRRGELPEKYIAKILYEWNDRKFEEEYLRKLERNWQKWKSVSLEKKPWRGDNVRVKDNRLHFNFLPTLIFFFILFILGDLGLGLSMTSQSHDTIIVIWS